MHQAGAAILSRGSSQCGGVAGSPHPARRGSDARLRALRGRWRSASASTRRNGDQNRKGLRYPSETGDEGQDGPPRQLNPDHNRRAQSSRTVLAVRLLATLHGIQHRSACQWSAASLSISRSFGGLGLRTPSPACVTIMSKECIQPSGSRRRQASLPEFVKLAVQPSRHLVFVRIRAVQAR